MKKLSVFLLLLALGLTGCWDVHDIDRRAFIFAIGIDRERDGSFLVSGRMARGAGGPETEVKSGPALTARGRSVGECMERMAGLSDRRLDWGNLRTIILGEDLSRTGAAEPLRAPLSAPRVPGDAVLLQARGRAADIVTWVPPGEEILQQSLENIYTKDGDEGSAPVLVAAWRFKSWLDNPGQDAFLGGVTRLPKSIVLREVALFRDGQLVGWLDAARAKVFQWTRGRAGGYALLRDPDTPSRTVSIRIRSARSRLKVISGHPDRLIMSLSLSGETIDVASGAGPEYLERVRRAVQAHIRRQVLEMARYAQVENVTDVWGFGELARRQDPGAWSKAAWRQRWRKAVWDVRTELHLEYRSRYGRNSF